jgi:hypothetical protein
MNSASLCSLAGYIGWRNSFLGIDSWVPQTFKNKGTGGDRRGGVGGGRGMGGFDLSLGISGPDVHQKNQNNTLSRLFRGGGLFGGVRIFLELERCDRDTCSKTTRRVRGTS